VERPVHVRERWHQSVDAIVVKFVAGQRQFLDRGSETQRTANLVATQPEEWESDEWPGGESGGRLDFCSLPWPFLLVPFRCLPTPVPAT